MDDTDKLIMNYINGGMTYAKTARSLRMDHGVMLGQDAIRKRVYKVRRLGLLDVDESRPVEVMPPGYNTVTTTTVPVGITRGELLARYDLSTIVRGGLEGLKRDLFLTTQEVASEMNILGRPGYVSALQNKENAAYCGKAVKGAVYWSHPESIAEMKSRHVLLPVNF